MMLADIDNLKWPESIRGINDLEREIKEAIYLSLVPTALLGRYGILPSNRDLVRINAPQDTRSFEVIVFRSPDDVDPAFYLHMADTLNYQIALLLLVINDLDSPRFNTDVDDAGRPTRFGTVKRNIAEEEKAMRAGLTPGQVHQGLRLSQQMLPRFERFIEKTSHDMVIIEPLTYSNAITYERYGFAYFQGQRRLEWINNTLRPGGELFTRFDGSTPFRQPDSWKSIRGRAWAIHDGILDEPFGDIRMYKRLGHHAGINTFPDGIW